jgi:hypothetical protein
MTHGNVFAGAGLLFIVLGVAGVCAGFWMMSDSTYGSDGGKALIGGVGVALFGALLLWYSRKVS